MSTSLPRSPGAADLGPAEGLTPVAENIRTLSIARWGAAQAVEIVGQSGEGRALPRAGADHR
jgi:hypothetical protein